jgi:hypothetical protein
MHPTRQSLTALGFLGEPGRFRARQRLVAPVGGGVVPEPPSGAATLTHAELLAIPNALSVIAAIQDLAYTRAVEQGL